MSALLPAEAPNHPLVVDELPLTFQRPARGVGTGQVADRIDHGDDELGVALGGSASELVCEYVRRSVQPRRVRCAVLRQQQLGS